MKHIIKHKNFIRALVAKHKIAFPENQFKN